MSPDMDSGGIGNRGASSNGRAYSRRHAQSGGALHRCPPGPAPATASWMQSGLLRDLPGDERALRARRRVGIQVSSRRVRSACGRTVARLRAGLLRLLSLPLVRLLHVVPSAAVVFLPAPGVVLLVDVAVVTGVHIAVVAGSDRRSSVRSGSARRRARAGGRRRQKRTRRYRTRASPPRRAPTRA